MFVYESYQDSIHDLNKKRSSDSRFETSYKKRSSDSRFETRFDMENHILFPYYLCIRLEQMNLVTCWLIF